MRLSLSAEHALQSCECYQRMCKLERDLSALTSDKDQAFSAVSSHGLTCIIGSAM